jgi:hypothetical protein
VGTREVLHDLIEGRLSADYQEFASRDLWEYEMVYLFVDGIAERIRPGQRRERCAPMTGKPPVGTAKLPSAPHRRQIERPAARHRCQNCLGGTK